MPFTSTRWGGNHQNVSNCHQQLLVKLINPPSPRGRPSGELTQAVDVQHVRDASVTHVHFRLVLLPALFHQLFQRLGHDLYQTITKQWATARRVQGEKWASPQLTLSSFPQVLGRGQRREGSGNKDGGWGARDREVGRVQHHSRRGEKQTQLQPHTHSLRRAALNRQKLQTSAARDALGRCKTSTQTRNTPCPGTPRRRTTDR